jgi:hypothetical protein
MKILCTMSDDEFEQVKRYLKCDDWSNPMQDEYIFYNPSDMFRWALALNGIETWQDNP